MLLAKAQRLLGRGLRRLGLEVRRASQRGTVLGALRQAHAAGLAPAAVLDVGGAWGGFTVQCLSVFPTAKYIVIEPLDEYLPALSRITAAHSNVELVQAAAGAEPGTVTFHVHPDLVGSSLLWEPEGGDVNGSPRTVPAITIDGIVSQRKLSPPYLLKLDVQGAELAVLSAAAQALRQAEYVILEVSLFRFFDGGHVLHDVVDFMRAHGLVAYDIFDSHYRPLDGALAQCDVVFVPEAGPLRTFHHYATVEQRRALTRRLTSSS